MIEFGVCALRGLVGYAERELSVSGGRVPYVVVSYIPGRVPWQPFVAHTQRSVQCQRFAEWRTKQVAARVAKATRQYKASNTLRTMS